jgi:hypothetical protein
MLVELPRVLQHADEPHRRVFRSPDLYLVVWVNDKGGYTGFELAYRHGPRERAMRWKAGAGYTHHRVDDGEYGAGSHKSSPLMSAEGTFKRWSVARQFQEESRDMDPDLAGFVMRKVLGFRKAKPLPPRATDAAQAEAPDAES